MNWLLIRGTGVAAFAFLAVSMTWGLLLSTRVLRGWTRPKALAGFHESLGAGALLLTVVHLVAVYQDEFIGFSWRDILLPGFSEWRPYGITVGVLAFYGLLAVTVGSYARRRLGARAWRVLHSLSLGVFVGALLHGVLAGTDTTRTPMIVLYAGATIAVVVLLWIRWLPGVESVPERRPVRGCFDPGGVSQKSLEACNHSPSSEIRMTKRS